MKPPVRGIPGMIDRPKKLSSHCTVKIKINNLSNETFLLPGWLSPGLTLRQNLNLLFQLQRLYPAEKRQYS